MEKQNYKQALPLKANGKQSLKRQITNQVSNDGSDQEEVGEKKQRVVPQILSMIGEYTLEQLKEMHPQQNVFQFGNIIISSQFDSGNLARCEEGDDPFSYNLWITTDSLPYFKNCGYRTWFYFGVKGTNKEQVLKFTIKNMNHQSKLYAAGLRPVYRLGNNAKWKRCSGNINWIGTPEGTQVTFEHSFTGQERDQFMYIAFTYPFSYEECATYFDQIHQKIKNNLSEKIYFHRELLGLSLEDRQVELITITGHNKKEEELEDTIKGLFPQVSSDDAISMQRFSKERPNKFRKKCVFLSARVHPGEVQSSFVLNGIVDFLVSNTEQSNILLDNYIFKIIPLLNPDGVYRGYFRLDTYNHNLNRFYLDPDPKFQPTIYAAKQAILQQHQYGNLHIYLDLHGHAVKKGCFIFGNALKGEEQALNMVFPKLVSMNSLNFDFAECSFSEKLMSVKDRGCGLSREGSGRVGIYKETGLIHCYTLECNFQTGRRINHLTPKIILESGEIEPEITITDHNSKMYKESKTPNYTIEVFEDVGRAVCLGLLDLIDSNPVSRLISSQYKNSSNLKRDLSIQYNLLPPQVIRQLKQEQQAKNQRFSQSANYRLIQPQQQPSQTRNNTSSSQTKSQEKTPKGQTLTQQAKLIQQTTNDKRSSLASKPNQLLSGPLEEIKEAVPSLFNQNKKGRKLQQYKYDNEVKTSENKLLNDSSLVKFQNSLNGIQFSKNPHKHTDLSLIDDPYFQSESRPESEENHNFLKQLKIRKNIKNTSDTSKKPPQQVSSSSKSKTKGGIIIDQRCFNEDQTFQQEATASLILDQQQFSAPYQEMKQCAIVNLDLRVPQYPQTVASSIQPYMKNQQKFQSSHHFATQNSLCIAQTLIAPNTAQALYQLSQGGNKLVPKLLEKHTKRMKSHLVTPVRMPQQQAQQQQQQVNCQTMKMMNENPSQSEEIKELVYQMMQRQDENGSSLKSSMQKSANMQRYSHNLTAGGNNKQQLPVVLKEVSSQREKTKRALSNSVWNKIKSTSFHYNGAIGTAAEAAE